jgi:cytochrome c6
MKGGVMLAMTGRWTMAGIALAALSCRHAAAQDQVEAGKRLFTQTAVPACAVCHTLAHAGSSGEIGPNLDELKPDASRVEKAVRNGIGQMPAFPALTEEQVKALAKYVAGAASQGK